MRLVVFLFALFLFQGCQPSPPLKDEIPIEEIKAAIEPGRDDMIAFLTKAVQYQSVEDFGYQLTDETKDLMQFVFKTAKGMGFTTRTAADGLVGVLEYGSGDEVVGVLIHLDVVPVSAEELPQWEHDPWAGEVIDNVVWGRGSQDDKGALASVLWASKILIDNQLHFKRKLRIVLGTKEEKNFESLRRYLQQESQPNYGIVTDGVYIVRGQKGIADLDFNFQLEPPAQSKPDRIVHWSGGTVVNTVPDQSFMVIKAQDPAVSREAWQAMIDSVTAELKSGESKRFYGVTQPYETNLSLMTRAEYIDKFQPDQIPEGDLVLSSTGVAVHGSTPWLGKNAIIEVALVASQMTTIPDDVYAKVARFMAQKIGLSTDASGMGVPFIMPEGLEVPPGTEPVTYAGTSLNPGILEDRGQGSLVLHVDYRIGLENSIPQLVEASRKACAPFSGQVPDPVDGAAYDSYYINDGDGLLEMVKTDYTTVNQHPPVLTIGAGANYMMLVDNFVSYGPVDFFAPGSTQFDPTLIRFHQKNERFEIDMLEHNVLNYAVTMQSMLQAETAPIRTPTKE